MYTYRTTNSMFYQGIFENNPGKGRVRKFIFQKIRIGKAGIDKGTVFKNNLVKNTIIKQAVFKDNMGKRNVFYFQVF